MNPRIKGLAGEALHMARNVANETEDSNVRELALAVFGLASAIDCIADSLPDATHRRVPKEAAKPRRRVRSMRNRIKTSGKSR
jgi:hypothetical protein